ncbi:MAG: response regulator [candidate division WOR-3 bacterium]
MKKSKILIVEDDLDTADMLRLYFEAQGYEVLTAAWGGDALEICQKTLPDLIIQDIRLPDIDGYEICRRLRDNLRTSQIPFIFLTEKREREDKIAGLRLGAIDYITKPFDVQELRLRVRNALRRAGYESLVNPITGLPGGRLVEEQLELLLGKSEWAILSISVNELDAFNEAYGFVAGDDVLRAVGLILNNTVEEAGTLEDFVGHPGGAGFIIITVPSKVEELKDKVVTRLTRAINYFYPIKDREWAQKRIQESPGNEKLVPLMSIAVSIVTNKDASFTKVQQIREALTKAKRVNYYPP